MSETISDRDQISDISSLQPSFCPVQSGIQLEGQYHYVYATSPFDAHQCFCTDYVCTWTHIYIYFLKFLRVKYMYVVMLKFQLGSIFYWQIVSTYYYYYYCRWKCHPETIQTQHLIHEFSTFNDTILSMTYIVSRFTSCATWFHDS